MRTVRQLTDHLINGTPVASLDMFSQHIEFIRITQSKLQPQPLLDARLFAFFNKVDDCVRALAIIFDPDGGPSCYSVFNRWLAQERPEYHLLMTCRNFGTYPPEALACEWIIESIEHAYDARHRI